MRSKCISPGSTPKQLAGELISRLTGEGGSRIRDVAVGEREAVRDHSIGRGFTTCFVYDSKRGPTPPERSMATGFDNRVKE